MESNNIFECIPQNDLDCYYNGKWKRIHKLSNNMNSTNNFTDVQDKIDDEMVEFIIDAQYGEDKIVDNIIRLRESYFNRTDGSDNLRHIVHLISKISNIPDLANMVYTMNTLGIDTFFVMGIMPHFRKPDVYTIAISEMVLTIDSKEIYDETSKELIKIYQDFLKKVYPYIKKNWGYNMSKYVDFVKNIILFEILFSKTKFLQSEIIDPVNIYHSLPYTSFLEKFDVSNFWKIILGKYLTPNDYVFYENPKYLAFLKLFLEKLTIDQLNMTKDYLVYALIKKYEPYTQISGALAKTLGRMDDELAIFTATFYNAFGYYLETIYEKKYHNSNKNEKIYQMFLQMKEYCGIFFQQTNFFTTDTKRHAIKKLNELDIIIGSQDYSIDLTQMPVLGNNLFDNLMLIDSFYFTRMTKLIGKQKNRRFLSINGDIFSFLVNAYYDPQSNIIFIPTSITHDTFFSMSNDIIRNYGSMGSIIAHEMMHCFDIYGAQFNHNGYLCNWWTDVDYHNFNIEIEKIKQHYSSLVFDGTQLDGSISISENMADIAGLKLSLRTYIKYYMPNINPKCLSNQEKKHLQRFFESWAWVLLELDNHSDNNAGNLNNNSNSFLDSLNFDVHSPNVVRINAPFSHMDEYYEIFDVRPHHGNYLDARLRAKFLDMVV